MRLPDVMAIVLGLSLTGYCVVAGPDFGAGILDLLSGSGAANRAGIARAIGPVWEANHVWLIFSITVLFSAFPAAFAAVGTALLAPLTLVLLAIVLRGVAFGLRSNPGGQARSQVRLGRLRCRERCGAVCVRARGRRACAGLERRACSFEPGAADPVDRSVRGHRGRPRGGHLRPARGELRDAHADPLGPSGDGRSFSP